MLVRLVTMTSQNKLSSESCHQRDLSQAYRDRMRDTRKDTSRK